MSTALPPSPKFSIGLSEVALPVTSVPASPPILWRVRMGGIVDDCWLTAES